MQVSTDNKYSIIATLAGCSIALNRFANSFCFSEKDADFDAPIITYIYILQYYNKINTF
jgi:hypothetical protein